MKLSSKIFFTLFTVIVLSFPSRVVLAWDVSTASYDTKNCSVTTQAINPLGMSFSEDGTKLYVVNHSNDTIYQYTLSTAWDVSTCSYANKSKSIASQDIDSYGLTFKSDGTKMYITGDSNDRVFQYSLSTAWDVSTASYDSVSFLLSSQSNWVKGITFKSDGTKMYMTDWQTIGKMVWQYSLSTPWVISSATYDNINFSYSSQVTQAGNTFFKPDGTKMYMIGLNNDTVFSYSLSTAWNVSTATYDNVSFSVSSQEVTPWDVFFKPDGSKMYAIGNSQDRVFQYSITSDITAPTITNVSSDKANGSYTVGEVIDIDVTFSEAVTSTGNVTVTLETGSTDRTCTFTVTSAATGTCNYTVQAGDTTADLTVNTVSGTITDSNSNAMVNFVPTTNLAANKALVIDTTDPILQSLTPADNEINFSPVSNFLMIFNGAVDIETGNITIKKTSDDSIVETISVSGGLVTGTGTNVITINPSINLSNLTDYYILVDATAFDDAAGNSYAGISSTTAWSFTTADIGIPAVVSFSPIDSASDVGIDDNLVIVFNEIVDVESGNLVIYKSIDDSVVATIPITDGQITGTGTNTITINPTANLDYATEYYVQIDATAFDDTSSNSYAGISNTTTWNFTTESAPVVEVSTRSSSGSSASSRYQNLINMGNIEAANTLINQYPSQFENQNKVPVVAPNEIVPANNKKFVFNKNLLPQVIDPDVLELQKFLNENGFIVSVSGPGSKGSETSYFGILTQITFKKFQEANRESILDPLGLTSGTGILGPSTRAFINAR